MEEPVLKSEKSIVLSISIIFFLIVVIIVCYYLFATTIVLTKIIAAIVLIGYIYCCYSYFEISIYTFYNEYFEIKDGVNASTETIYYTQLAEMKLHTTIVRDNIVGLNSPMEGPSQNEILELILKDGRTIIFSEFKYDNFKLMRKLFSELSEKEDTSKLN